MLKLSTKCIQCLHNSTYFIYMYINCIIHPQPEQRNKLKCEMQETVSMNVNITPLSLVNTQSASPGEASPSHAGRLAAFRYSLTMHIHI